MAGGGQGEKVHVLLLTDACHSGTMFRSLSLNVTYRKSPKPKIDRAELFEIRPPAPNMSETVGPNDDVTFLAGVSDDRLVPEVVIDGQPRGALSWSFARALEGAADSDHDGTVTEKELISYVRASVLQHTDSQQVSQSFPPVSRDIAVLKLKGGGGDLPMMSRARSSWRRGSRQPDRSTWPTAAGRALRAWRAPPSSGDPETADFVYDVDKQTVEKKVAGVGRRRREAKWPAGHYRQVARHCLPQRHLRQAGLRPSRSPADRAPTSAARS